MKQNLPHNTAMSASRQLKIEECLLENMKSVPYDHISVAALCRQMGISRQLFYTYFPDKDTCLHSLIDRMIRDSIDEILAVPLKNRHYDGTVAYLSYWQKHADFLNIVIRQNMKALVFERSYLYFKNNRHLIMGYLSTPEVEADDTILYLYAAVRFTALMQWHESGYALPVEKMAVKYLRLLKQPIIQDNI